MTISTRIMIETLARVFMNRCIIDYLVHFKNRIHELKYEKFSNTAMV